MELSAFLVSEASTMATNYTTIPTWSTAIVLISKWVTQEKHFHARWLVSYLLINNNICSCNRIAIDDRLSRISSKTATDYTNACCINGDCKPVFLHGFSREDGYVR